MDSSLKAALPELADMLGRVTAVALYERQRALVAEGLLEAEPGRGPGSGARLTPHSLAVLLIGWLASLHLADSAKLARNVVAAKSIDGKCPLTGKASFVDAFAELLASERLLERAQSVSVCGARGTAAIEYSTRNRKERSEFASKSDEAGLQITITLNFYEIPGFAKRIAALWRGE